MLACTAVSIPPAVAGQVEADFNDMLLGNTMTRINTGSENYLNVNSGSGFLPNIPTDNSGGRGEYNNNTGVVQFEKGDLILPAGASPGYVSVQESPVDPKARGTNSGVVFGSSTNASGEVFTRMQDRGFATPMTNSVIWFSFLFRADGPNAQGALVFNPPADSDSGSNTGDFLISIGSPTTPGAVAINLNPAQTPAALVPGGPANLIYYDGIGTSDHNGNGVVDGVSVGKEGTAGIRTHLIIGRITQNTAASGPDTIEVWLDPANGADPTGQTPTLSYTGDEIPTTGLAAIGFKGTRAFAPAPAGGPYTSGGHFAIDHVRLSDQGNALAFVTGNAPPDPKLALAPGSPGNFNFRGVYGTGTPLSSQPITVTLRNEGTANPIQITGIDFATATTVFTVTDAPTLPFTLAPQATTTITMQAGSGTFETTFTNSLKVSTDHPDQDMALSVSATFYSAGSRINQNSSLDSNINSWVTDNFTGDDTPPGIVTPGFIGTVGKALMKGAGHPGGGNPDNLSQTVLNGARDWELTFFFSPLTAAQFESRNGGSWTGTDRLFQVIIQSDSLVPVPAYSTFGSWTDLHNGVAGMINLAYLPAQGGFRVFNGSNWQTTGLPALTGPADQNNVYLVRVKGTGFGTASAKYNVSVSQPNSTLTAATSADLTVWSSASGQTNTPGAYTFTTGDVSTSGGATVKTGSYWLDEVSFFSVQARDPDYAITAQTVFSHEGTTTAGGLVVTNTGFNNDLVIDSMNFQFAHVFNSPQAFPMTIPAGTSATIPVNMVNGFTTTNNAARGGVNFTMNNVPLAPTRSVALLGTYTSAGNLAGNWNFEIPGGDVIGDSDSFGIWYETGNITNSKDATGLVDGSTISAFVGQDAIVYTPLGAAVDDFSAELLFAFKDSSDRAFNIQLGAANGSALGLFYRGGAFYATENETETFLFEVPLEASGDANNDNSLGAGETKHVYRMHINCEDWNSGPPTYQINISTLDGTPVYTSERLAYFTGSPAGGGNRIQFYTQNIPGAGFWVDNVRVAAASAGPGVVITSIAGGAGGFTLTWDSGGAAVTVERSTTLQPGSWETVSQADADGTFSDATAPPGAAFYRVVKD